MHNLQRAKKSFTDSLLRKVLKVKAQHPPAVLIEMAVLVIPCMVGL